MAKYKIVHYLNQFFGGINLFSYFLTHFFFDSVAFSHLINRYLFRQTTPENNTTAKAITTCADIYNKSDWFI